MRNTINYSKSPLPAFDAINDVMEWFGPERYAKIAPVPKFKWTSVKGQPRPWDSYRGVRRNWARWLRYQDLMIKRQARGQS
jgi:hypothetical protein